jgi:hypothetical protein
MDEDTRKMLEGDQKAWEQYQEFATTPAGKKLMSDLEDNVFATANTLFKSVKNPDLSLLVAGIVALQVNAGILRKFTNAKSEAAEISRILSAEKE